VSLRSAFTANLPLKLTSLGLSLFLWLLAAAEEPASALLPVDVLVTPPRGRNVLHTSGPVRALVVGPRRELLKLSTTPMHLTRILPDTLDGDETRLDLSPGESELPHGVNVRVQDLEPRSVMVQLDSTFQRVVPVHAMVRLAADPGYAIDGISVIPGTVRLLGPRERLRELDSVHTEPLEVDLADAPVEQPLRLDTSGFGPVRVFPQAVTVRVDVEAAGERTLGDVPVRLPSAFADVVRSEQPTVRVKVRGPAARLSKLAPESVMVVVDGSSPPAPGRLPLRIVLPHGFTGVAEPDSVDLVRRGAGHG
jgi:hypothetical protein